MIRYHVDGKIRQEKLVERTSISVKNVPRKDELIAGLALASRDRLLIVANVDGRSGDNKLVKAPGKLSVSVLTCTALIVAENINSGINLSRELPSSFL